MPPRGRARRPLHGKHLTRQNRLKRVRKISATVATLSLAVVALTGCTAVTPQPPADCDRASSTSGIDSAATITGEIGSAPEVEIFGPVHADKTSFTDVISGEGLALTDPNQLAVIDLALYSGETGEEVVTTGFGPDRVALSTMANWQADVPAIDQLLRCATPGTRVLGAITPEDFTDERLGAFGFEDDETVVVVADVREVLPSRATGQLQFNDANGMPTVVRAPDGRPGVIIPGSPAPTAQVTQVLIKGDGENLEPEQTPITHFTQLNWNDRKVSNTTWGTVPAGNLASSVPEVAAALEGAAIGSQILTVIPNDEGDAVVYVIDLLGVVPEAAQ